MGFPFSIGLFGDRTEEAAAITVLLVILAVAALVLRARYKRKSIERFTRRYGR